MVYPLNSVFTARPGCHYMGRPTSTTMYSSDTSTSEIGGGRPVPACHRRCFWGKAFPMHQEKMVPFSSFTRVEMQLGLDQINSLRLMLHSGRDPQCGKPGNGSGRRHPANGKSNQRASRGRGSGYEWTSVAIRRHKAGTTTTVVFVMALLVASQPRRTIPRKLDQSGSCIMGLPLLLGAMLNAMSPVSVSIYTQMESFTSTMCLPKTVF